MAFHLATPNGWVLVFLQSLYWQAAKTKQLIAEQKKQIEVIERSQAIQIQEQEIVRKERELDAKVKKPAEAEKYRLEKLAEANKSVFLLAVVLCTVLALLYD